MSAPASVPHWHFVLPGDWDQVTGGYRYDRRIGLGLRALGWRIDPLVLSGAFPYPDAQALSLAELAVAALPDGARVLADCLAFGAMPEVVERHADRLCWVALLHHPLWLETGCTAPEVLREREARALVAARRVIVTSQTTAGFMDALGVPAARVAVVEPGTDPRPLAEGAGGGALNLLCVATVTPRKGHRHLVEALAAWRDRPWTLQVVGSLTRDAACADELRAVIEAQGLGSKVQLLGEIDDDEALASCYQQADAFVLASQFEGYGMAFAEALSHGLPIVGTRGGATERTVPADAGVLVEPGDVAALSRVLGRLLDDAGWRAQLAAGAARARENLRTWEMACDRFADVLADVDRLAG